MSLTRHLSGLAARFDRLALRPPAPAADAAAQAASDGDTRAALEAWCWRGAGPGTSPWWRPGARPAVALRLAVAALRGPDEVALRAWADAFARQLDGSLQLDALRGRAARLELRLRAKAHEAMWWRARRPGDPWDAGWAVVTPPAQRHFRTHFMPRRATLILADRREADPLRLSLAALVQRHADFRHPVRWLWVGGDSDQPAQNALAVERFELGRDAR